MSKRLWVLPVLAALLVAGSGVGYAIPSLGGPTGVVSLPNALVAPVGELQTALSYQKMTTPSPEVTDFNLVEAADMYWTGTGGDTVQVPEDVNAWSLQALAGVADGAELWAAYSKDNSILDRTIWGIGGKYRVVTEATSGAAFAIGASYQSGKGDANVPWLFNVDFYDPATPDESLAALSAFDIDAKVTKLYGVVTKDFASMTGSEWSPGSKLLGSLGLMYLKLSEDTVVVTTIPDGDLIDIDPNTVTDSFAFDESLFRPFVAVQWISADKTYLGLEYRWKDDDLDASAVFSAVLGHDFGNGFSGEVGTTNADQFGLGLDDQNWFARVGYTFATGEGW